MAATCQQNGHRFGAGRLATMMSRSLRNRNGGDIHMPCVVEQAQDQDDALTLTRCLDAWDILFVRTEWARQESLHVQ